MKRTEITKCVLFCVFILIFIYKYNILNIYYHYNVIKYVKEISEFNYHPNGMLNSITSFSSHFIKGS